MVRILKPKHLHIPFTVCKYSKITKFKEYEQHVNDLICALFAGYDNTNVIQVDFPWDITKIGTT